MNRAIRIAIAVVLGLVSVGVVGAGVASAVAGEYLAAVLCLPTAVGTGYMFVHDVRALTR